MLRDLLIRLGLLPPRRIVYTTITCYSNKGGEKKGHFTYKDDTKPKSIYCMFCNRFILVRSYQSDYGTKVFLGERHIVTFQSRKK